MLLFDPEAPLGPAPASRRSLSPLPANFHATPFFSCGEGVFRREINPWVFTGTRDVFIVVLGTLRNPGADFVTQQICMKPLLSARTTLRPK